MPSILAHNSDNASGPVSGSLGTIAKNVSTASESLSASVFNRFVLQSAARDLVPRERVAFCLRRPIPTKEVVDVFYAPVSSSSHYGGLQVCGSVWMCPVCASKISEKRRIDMSDGIRSFYDESGIRRVLLVTFTLSHSIRDNLSDVLSVLRRARRLLLAGRWWSDLRGSYGIVGQVRALECTYGSNGWHPHMHVLLFFEREVPIIPFTDDMKSRWSFAVSSAGGVANYANGCDVRFTDAEIAEYVAKWGKDPKWTASHELAKAVVKRGRSGGLTPLQLLSMYSGGDNNAGVLWLQYALNFKGMRQLFWSRGLRVRLGLKVEKTDEELAKEQDEIAILLAQLTIDQWRVVIGNDARADLLNVAMSGDRIQVLGFLSSIGVFVSDYASDY